MGGASEVDQIVECMALSPDKMIYLGGLFSALGGANGDYLAYYDPATDTFGDLAEMRTSRLPCLSLPFILIDIT